MDQIGKKSRRNEDFLPADAYLNSTRHVRGQDYLPHPKLIIVWSIQVYAIVLEFGPGESCGLEGFKSLQARSG